MKRHQKTEAHGCKKLLEKESSEKDQQSSECEDMRNERKDGEQKRKEYRKRDCIHCGKIFAHRQSLCHHKNTCDLKRLIAGSGLTIKYFKEKKINDDLRKKLIGESKAYAKRIKFGKRIAKILESGEVAEESLSEGCKVALDLYRKQQIRVDISYVETIYI